jgi:hypothetical protein
MWRLALLAVACSSSSSDQPPAPAPDPGAQAPAVASVSAPVTLAEPLTGDDVGTPGLVRNAAGELLLSYSVKVDGAWAVKVALIEGTGWQPIGALPVGPQFAPIHSDPPALIRAGDGSLVATWGESPAKGAPPEALHLFAARSADGGRTWRRFGPLHADRSPTEHSFVALAPMATGSPDLLAVWLDGGNLASPGGATALRTARIRGDATTGELLLDPRACDCCATAAVLAGAGPLIAYRDRGDDELRDISTLRTGAGGAWQPPAALAADGWVIDGCPVNGPALLASGERVAAAWFTGAGDRPRVRAALSADGGATFPSPVDVDTPVGARKPLGRVGLTSDGKEGAILTWLAADGARAFLMARRLPPSDRPPLQIGETVGLPTSGIPRAAAVGPNLIVVWRVPGPPATIQTARVPLAALPLGEIEDQHLGVAGAGDGDGLALDGGAVAGRQLVAVDLDLAAGDVDPGAAAGGQLVGGALAGGEQAGVHGGVLVDGHAAVAAVARGDQAQAAAALGVGEPLLLVARTQAALLGQDPDLQQVQRLGARRIDLAVGHAGAGGHALDLTGLDDRAGAHRVAVLQLAAEHVGDDLHVGVRVGAEAAAGGNLVVVDHPQGPIAHVARIPVVGEREGVPGVQPAVVGVAAFVGASQGDHRLPLPGPMPTNRTSVKAALSCSPAGMAANGILAPMTRGKSCGSRPRPIVDRKIRAGCSFGSMLPSAMPSPSARSTSGR